MKRLFTILFLLIGCSTFFAQSYHTISIDGNNDFNITHERFETTSGTQLYSYVTWDDDYLYLGFSGNSPHGPVTDPTRVYHIYIDTDPEKNPTDGTGTTDGITWRWDPTLPFTANVHYAFKTDDNTVYRQIFTGGSWQDSAYFSSNWKNTTNHFWEVRIRLSEIGDPTQLNLIAYVEEDFDTGFICGGIPSNLFTNTDTQGSITFNNHWLNFYQIDQIFPNLSYNEDNFQWLLRLNASTTSLSDTTSWAGMGLNATNGWDENVDLANPPIPASNYVEVYFPHPGWGSNLGPNYMRDIKAYADLDSTTSSWSFTVDTDRTNTDVTLSADMYDHVPSSYPINIYDITADSTHNIKASDYVFNTGTNLSTRNFNLIIGTSLAPPDIASDSDTLDFGSVKINRDSTINLEISNLGDSTLVISDINSSNNAFTFAGDTSYNITGNSSVTIPVTFSPSSVISYNGTLSFISNDPDENPFEVTLLGEGQNLFPEISLSTSSLDFGNVQVDYSSDLSFKIYNTGDTSLVISNITSTNSVFTFDTGVPVTILKNDSLSVNVTFAPTETITYNDTLSITSNDQDEGVVDVTLAGTGITSTVSNEYAAGWNLMSIPVMPDDPRASQVIGDDISTFFLYDYSNTGGYQTADSLFNGFGYWLGIESTTTVDVTGTGITEDDSVGLSSGWNIVASPFLRKYMTSSIYFNRNDTTVNADSAVSLGWIQDTYYGYNLSSGSYFTEDTLKQWNGYWFATLTSGLNMVFYHDSTTGTPLRIRHYEMETSPDHWFANIKAEMNGLVDQSLVFGADINATDGFDNRFDFAEPPLAPAANAIQTYFSYNNWSPLFTKYSADIREKYIDPEPGKNWTFKFVSKTEGRITLSWENIIEEIPEEIRNSYSFELTGTGITSDLNMLNQFTHSFEAEANQVYQFTINSTLTGVEDNAVVYTYKLEQNYPNPFNPGTMINYQIKNAGQVSLTVYNLLGEKITTLVNEFKNPGIYNVYFDASRLASGVYYYKITAGDFVNVKKMILLK